MSEVFQPEWLKGYKSLPDQAVPTTGWKKGMKSPNPQGRPKGIVDKRSKVTQALMDDAPAIARVVIDAALAGDIHAAGVVLSRVAPPLKPQSEMVSFNFDARASLTCQVEAVLQAISNGEMSPDAGKQIIDAIGSLGAIKQIDELEARLVALEGRRK